MKRTLLLSFDSNTQSKMSVFTAARLGLLTSVLFTTIFLRQEVLGAGTIAQIYSCIGVSFFLSLINVTFWSQTLRVRYFIPSQLLYDLLLTSYLVFLTGVNDSIFLFLYLLNIVFASVIYQLNGALIVSALSGLIYAAIYYVNMNTDIVAAWYNLFYSELLFLLTALLCGQLMDELKRQKLMLATQEANIVHLKLLNDRLLNNIPAGILVIDGEDYVQNINRTALSLLCIEKTPDIRLKYYELLPSLRGVTEAWPRMTEKQRLRFSFHHGSDRRLRFSLQVVRIADAPTGSEELDRQRQILIFQDISKVLELERKLEMESKLAATGQLAAGIAHEIRNPLASISGSIEMLSSHLRTESQEEKKLLEISLRETRRLNRLITEFLEFAKPRKNETKEVPLLPLVNEVKEAILSRASQGVELRFELAIDPSAKVFADRERLKQVFFNLFINSMEAAKASTLTLGVRTSPPDSEGLLSIEVWDDGSGIPESVAPKIFDPFFTTKQNGTGLGLATVAQIVREAKGEIHLEPDSKGARFLMVLPMQENSMAQREVYA